MPKQNTKRYRPAGTIWEPIPEPPKKDNPWPSILVGGFVVLLVLSACGG